MWMGNSACFILHRLIWCITIIGIPFGVQSIKFAQLAIMPFGAEVVKA